MRLDWIRYIGTYVADTTTSTSTTTVTTTSTSLTTTSVSVSTSTTVTLTSTSVSTTVSQSTSTSVSTSTTLAPGYMLFVTGSYVGDGIDNRWINDPAFEPDLVLIRSGADDDCVWKSSAMPGETALLLGANNGSSVNRIQAFGVNGFQIGDNTDVNENGTTYHWACFRDNNSDNMQVGSYFGDGTDDRDITGIGFQPDIVWVQSSDILYATWRVAEHSGDDCSYFYDAANVSNRIQGFIADGFQVGSDNETNQNARYFYYVCFKDLANYIETGSYVGNGADDRNIVAPNFEPDLVFVKGDAVQDGVLRTSTFVGDSSVIFDSGVNPAADQIQSLIATGFQVGTSSRVNSVSAYTYYWSVWREQTTSTTTSTSLTTSTTSVSTSVSTSTTVTLTSTSTSFSTSTTVTLTSTSVSTSLTTSTSVSASTSLTISTSISTTTLAHPPVSPVEEACVGQAEYQVKVRDTDGNYIAVFHGAGRGVTGGGMRSLSYRKRVRTPGGWEVRIDGDDERIALLELRREAPTHLDYIFEFWRHDSAGGLDWYEDFAGFHRSDRFTQNAEGQEIYVARGRGFNDLIAAEPIRYDKSSAEALKTGVCETVAKEYINENIGPGAPVTRQMPGLTVEASASTGATWTGDRANKALYDILVELAEAAPGDFTIEHTGPASFEFRWRDGQWGEDKTRGNGIRPAVVFGARRGNLTDMNYSYSRLDEVNVCYVGGPARGTLREYVTRTTGAENDSPWARRAVFRNASNSATTAALNAKGDETLEKQEPKRTFDFEVIQTQATRYGRDWDVGDLVTEEFRGQDFNQKVVGVYISMGDDGVENIQPELEDS